MDTKNSNEYFLQKIQLLKQCISLSEELLSSLEDWESLNEILAKRGAVIQQLQNLDQSFGEKAMHSCSEVQKSEINRLVSLILALDRDASKLIKEEQTNLMSAIKINRKEQKIFNYKINTATESGSRLDYKE